MLKQITLKSHWLKQLINKYLKPEKGSLHRSVIQCRKSVALPLMIMTGSECTLNGKNMT